MIEYRISDLVLFSFWILECRHKKHWFEIPRYWSGHHHEQSTFRLPPQCNPMMSKEPERKTNRHAHGTRDQNVGLFSKRKIKEVFQQSTLNRFIWDLFVQKKDKRGVNSICAMGIDITPAAGAARSRSKISLGRNRFEIGIRPFLCEAGSSPLMGLSSNIFSNVFPVNQRHIYRYFGSGSNSWLTQRLNLTPVLLGAVVRTSAGLFHCQLGGYWLIVHFLVKTLFLF